MIDLSRHKRIHCIGIGGVGVSALADILLERGYIISGSDMAESENTERLALKGVNIHIGHRAENVEGADLVLYSTAVAMDNPEFARAEEMGVPMISRGEMLGLLMEEYKDSVAISGTHGKTTTTSMVSFILENGKYNPTVIVGGTLPKWGANARIGGADFFVAEACEYRNSYLELRPKDEIILNIDLDHIDYFKNIDNIVKSFKTFSDLARPDGRIFAYMENEYVRRALEGKENIITFGYAEGADFRAKNIGFDEKGHPHFDAYHGEEKLCRVQLAVPGEHNVLNALAAIAYTYDLGVDIEVIKTTIEAYDGTKRRFEIVGVTNSGAYIVDDYAHHPTEINMTLKAAQNIPHNRIWCVLQPHTYTRTLAMMDDYIWATEPADVIVVTEIFAAREKDIYNVKASQVYDKIKAAHPEKEVYHIETFEDIARFADERLQRDDYLITMSCGDINKVCSLIMDLQ